MYTFCNLLFTVKGEILLKGFGLVTINLHLEGKMSPYHGSTQLSVMLCLSARTDLFAPRLCLISLQISGVYKTKQLQL